jgi:predicted lipid-binding transport protein (Tim44 family)
MPGIVRLRRPAALEAGSATFIDFPGAGLVLMHIVAIGWMYVVLMMSLTEKSFVAGIMTFVFYGVVPVGIIWYLSGSGRRRFRARAAQRAAAESQAASTPTAASPESPEAPAPSEKTTPANRELP